MTLSDGTLFPNLLNDIVDKIKFEFKAHHPERLCPMDLGYLKCGPPMPVCKLLAISL